MKKFLKFVRKNSTMTAGIFLAGVAITAVGAKAYSELSDLKAQQFDEPAYGMMGYGRGYQRDDGERNSGHHMGGMMRNQDSDDFRNSQRGLNKDNCLMDGCLLVEDAEYPVADLNEETIGYLEAAIADERKALGTYEATMDKFGAVRPFINIARAEEQHISMLKALFDKYGLEIPADETNVGELPETLGEVCAVGVQAEIDNDQLYQEMIPHLEQEDIKAVFISLANASLEMHLPAFERCAN